MEFPLKIWTKKKIHPPKSQAKKKTFDQKIFQVKTLPPKKDALLFLEKNGVVFFFKPKTGAPSLQGGPRIQL